MITGIGSFPFTDIDEALDLIFETCSEIPFWPQLPKRSPLENMYGAFLEGVPSIVAEEGKDTPYVDTKRTEGIERFYDDYFSGNLDPFMVSQGVAPGFYRFLERLGGAKERARYIKGQLTGPFSMGLGLKDEQGKPIIYNNAYFDIIKKALNMKAKWIVSMIKSACPEHEVIIFFDEPYLVSFGSAYVSISKEEAIGIIDETMEGVEAKKGVHCCGNTDWSVLLNTTVDIINYDAYNFLETIFYYKEDLEKFYGRGGWISPGIVPSSEEVLQKTASDILELLKSFTGLMNEASKNNIGKDFLITTSCGLGSLNDPEARRAMELLGQLG